MKSNSGFFENKTKKTKKGRNGTKLNIETKSYEKGGDFYPGSSDQHDDNDNVTDKIKIVSTHPTESHQNMMETKR